MQTERLGEICCDGGIDSTAAAKSDASALSLELDKCAHVLIVCSDSTLEACLHTSLSDHFIFRLKQNPGTKVQARPRPLYSEVSRLEKSSFSTFLPTGGERLSQRRASDRIPQRFPVINSFTVIKTPESAL